MPSTAAPLKEAFARLMPGPTTYKAVAAGDVDAYMASANARSIENQRALEATARNAVVVEEAPAPQLRQVGGRRAKNAPRRRGHSRRGRRSSRTRASKATTKNATKSARNTAANNNKTRAEAQASSRRRARDRAADYEYQRFWMMRRGAV